MLVIRLPVRLRTPVLLPPASRLPPWDRTQRLLHPTAFQRAIQTQTIRRQHRATITEDHIHQDIEAVAVDGAALLEAAGQIMPPTLSVAA